MRWFLGALLALLLSSPAQAGVYHFDPFFNVLTIHMDGGGLYLSYDGQANEAASNGTLVKINGVCASACTLFLRNTHVCITEKARLGFHAAASLVPTGRGRDSRDRDTPGYYKIIDPDFTKNVMYPQYPKWVQKWIDDNDAFKTRRMTWMSFDYAKRFIEVCA